MKNSHCPASPNLPLQQTGKKLRFLPSAELARWASQASFARSRVMKAFIYFLLALNVVGCASSPPGCSNRPTQSTSVPFYPLNAVAAGHEGTVVVRAQVLNDGTFGKVDIESASGSSELDDAAIAAVRRTRASPALLEKGKAAGGWLTIPVTFKLCD